MKIPFLSTPDKPLTSTTQDFIPVADLADGIVIYKDGGASLIMQSTSLNFSLLSEREQEAVIAAYAGMVNSVKFPVQIVVRSQKKDIDQYLELLDSAKTKIKSAQLAELLEDYKGYITSVIKKQNVLSKSFYVVIPFTPYELGITKSFMTQVVPTKKNTPLPFPKSYVVRKAKIALYPKRDHLMHQAGRVGLELKPLTNEELIKLFFNIYNPEPPVKDKELFS
jgi:hypothetical protein